MLGFGDTSHPRRGQGPERQSLDPGTLGPLALSCPIPLGPEMQSLSPREGSVLFGERGWSEAFIPHMSMEGLLYARYPATPGRYYGGFDRNSLVLWSLDPLGWLQTKGAVGAERRSHAWGNQGGFGGKVASKQRPGGGGRTGLGRGEKGGVSRQPGQAVGTSGNEEQFFDAQPSCFP